MIGLLGAGLVILLYTSSQLPGCGEIFWVVRKRGEAGSREVSDVR